ASKGRVNQGLAGWGEGRRLAVALRVLGHPADGPLAAPGQSRPSCHGDDISGMASAKWAICATTMRPISFRRGRIDGQAPGRLRAQPVGREPRPASLALADVRMAATEGATVSLGGGSGRG